MNLISINFRNIFTIGLISMLGSAVVRFAESKTGVDIDRDGVVSDSPFGEGKVPSRAKPGKYNGGKR